MVSTVLSSKYEFPPFFHHFSHWFHNVAFFPRHHPFFHSKSTGIHVSHGSKSLQKDLYIYIYSVCVYIYIYLPPPQTIGIKVLWLYILSPKYTRLMPCNAAFCAKTWDPESMESQKFDFVGVCWKLGSFYPKKQRLRANVPICAKCL